jgi:hypothetical protein
VGDLTAQAATGVRRAEFDVVLRPRRSLVRSTVLSIAFSAVPLAVALVWVSLPLQLWPFVAGVVIALAVLVAVVFVRLGTAFIGIDQQGVSIRGVITRSRTVARERVHSLVLATIHGGAVDRTSRELVALDPAGGHLFRMRSDVWSDAGIDRVVDVLGVQVTEDPHPVSARAFARRYPSSRAWYEQRGAHVVVVSVAAVVVAGLLFIETVTLFHR